ncbi:MAG: peptidylprolyl isomerase [Clostridia bacterium]
MKLLKKLTSMLLCLCMLLSVTAMAEGTTPTDAPADTTEATAAPSTVKELAATDVLATIGEEPVTMADIQAAYDSLIAQYGANYDLTVQDNVDLFRAVALENAITERLLMKKAVELKLDLTAEEAATVETQADNYWQAALDNYVAQARTDITAESTAEDKAAAQAEAVKYYNDMNYSPESLREDYKRFAVFDKVEAYATQDAVVTDEEIEKQYQDLLAADKELYQNDVAAYVEYNTYVKQMAAYSQMYGAGAPAMDHAWYRPAGFRGIKHILLEVDPALLSTYTDLQARYEEQQNAEASAAQDAAAAEPAADAAATAEPTAVPEPVTEAQINDAKAAILASLATKIDEINQKIADGADFDELIATYGVKADGTPTDGGMTVEPYKTVGYEVAKASNDFVPEFVEAAFSVNNIGDVSAPYLSNYGVHIVKYIGDVAEGPIAMTDAERATKQAMLLSAKKNELYSKAVEQWIAQGNVVYTGVTPSIADVQAKQAAADAAANGAPTENVSETEAAAQVEADATEAPTEAPAE